MALWKRIKENRLEKAAKVREGRTVSVLPQSVLIWIDAACNDLPARIVRGLALAEAFVNAGIERVTVSCLECRNVPAETEKRSIAWIHSRPNGNPITFNEIVKQAGADLVIADSVIPPRLQLDIHIPLFALLADLFFLTLFESDRVNAVLLPGLIEPPDFETLSLLPSRVGDTIHGLQYVPLPGEYFTPPPLATPPEHALIAVSGMVDSDLIKRLIEIVHSAGINAVSILADIPSLSADSLRMELSDACEFLIDPPLPARLAALRNTRLILAFPSLSVYELLSQHRPLVLLPRSERETRTSRLILERGAARVIPAGETSDALKTQVEELLHNEPERNQLMTRASELIPSGGARNLVEVLLTRYAQGARRHTNA